MGNLGPESCPDRAGFEEPPPLPTAPVPALARSHRWLFAASGVVGVSAFALLGWPLVEKTRASDTVPRVSMTGVPLPQSGEGQAHALELARRWAAGTFTIVLPDSQEKLTLSKAELGIELDKAKLVSRLSQLNDESSPTRRELSRRRAGEVSLGIAYSFDTETALSALYRLKDRIDRSPVDARIDLRHKKLVSEQPGRWLDVWGTLARIESALSAGHEQIEALIATKPARITTKELASVEYDEVLGWFETRYTLGRKYEARTFNLRLAASKLDGHVLFPGEEFDFNEIVGPRDEANGYKVATVIASGELVDGIGGGTCQVAGTLHGAAMFSGLQVVERRPHTRPSGYIKMGLDAAVVYPTITLKLRNTFSYPVVLREVVEDGVVRAEVRGPKGAKKTVTYMRKIDGFTPFQEVERQDPKLPKGVKVLAQRGIPGFKLRRYRVVRDGAFAERERWNDYYPPTSQIIRVGTGDMPKDSVKYADDPHPEYVADAYLMMMQGPEVESAKGMIEVREAGESGRYGWTERAGFSHWSPGKQTAEGEGEACIEAACARPGTRAKTSEKTTTKAKATAGKQAEKRADERKGQTDKGKAKR